MDWDHLRTFEAVARAGTLTAAAQALGTSQSTVSRRLGKLESEAGSPLLLRESPLRLTDRGEALLAAMAPMVAAAQGVEATLEQSPAIRGEVTLTTVGELLRWRIADRIGGLYRAYPELRVRAYADNQVASLAAGEADVALRLVRPERGDLVVQLLYTESYALFAAPSLELGSHVPWLGLTGSLSRVPEQLYAERAFEGRVARLLVEDVESLAIAVRSGLGVAVLPRALSERVSSLVEVSLCQLGARDYGALPERDVWMVVHRGKFRLPRVRALMDWLVEEASHWRAQQEHHRA